MHAAGIHPDSSPARTGAGRRTGASGAAEWTADLPGHRRRDDVTIRTPPRAGAAGARRLIGATRRRRGLPRRQHPRHGIGTHRRVRTTRRRSGDRSAAPISAGDARSTGGRRGHSAPGGQAISPSPTGHESVPAAVLVPPSASSLSHCQHRPASAGRHGPAPHCRDQPPMRYGPMPHPQPESNASIWSSPTPANCGNSAWKMHVMPCRSHPQAFSPAGHRAPLHNRDADVPRACGSPRTALVGVHLSKTEGSRQTRAGKLHVLCRVRFER